MKTIADQYKESLEALQVLELAVHKSINKHHVSHLLDALYAEILREGTEICCELSGLKSLRYMDSSTIAFAYFKNGGKQS